MSGHGMKMDTPEAGKNEDASADHASMNHAAMDHVAMGHAAPGNASMQMDHSMHGASGANAMVSHPASETGNPAVDMQTMTPSRALDDTGIDRKSVVSGQGAAGRAEFGGRRRA